MGNDRNPTGMSQGWRVKRHRYVSGKTRQRHRCVSANPTGMSQGLEGSRPNFGGLLPAGCGVSRAGHEIEADDASCSHRYRHWKKPPRVSPPLLGVYPCGHSPAALRMGTWPRVWRTCPPLPAARFLSPCSPYPAWTWVSPDQMAGPRRLGYVKLLSHLVGSRSIEGSGAWDATASSSSRLHRSREVTQQQLSEYTRRDMTSQKCNVRAVTSPTVLREAVKRTGLFFLKRTICFALRTQSDHLT